MKLLKICPLIIFLMIMITCVLTLNKPSTEKCTLFRNRQDSLRIAMDSNQLCGFSREDCAKRKAKFYKNNRKGFCGCRCLKGFDTYRRDINSCVQMNKAREECTIQSGLKRTQAIGMMPPKPNASLKLNLSTMNSSFCVLASNTSRFLDNNQWLKFKEGSFPFKLVKNRFTKDISPSKGITYRALHFIKWELSKRRFQRKKTLNSLRGKLVKIGIVCNGVYTCAMLKVPGKLPCAVASQTPSAAPTTVKTTQIHSKISDKGAVANQTSSAAPTMEKTQPPTKMPSQAIFGRTEQTVTTENQQQTKPKSTVSSVVDGVDSRNRKDDDKSQSLSLSATIAGTTVTMALVLIMGILLGYYCRIKKRKDKSKRRPSVETLDGTKINNFGAPCSTYRRNRSVSEGDDATSVYSEISNLTDINRKQPPPFHNVIDAPTRHTNDKLPPPPTSQNTNGKPNVNNSAPALPPTPEYIRRSLLLPSKVDRGFTNTYKKQNKDKVKDINTVSSGTETCQDGSLLSLGNPVYEVPIDERPASPTYVDPDQLSDSDDCANEKKYLELII